MTYGSLFTGIGGIDLGLDRAGMTCAWQVEYEPFCTKVLEKHWPGVKRYGDIRTIEAETLEAVDLICGGYPCQPFSQAGKRAGADDPRHLWPEFARILRFLRPRYVLLENVPGHLSLGFGAVLGDLAGLGYDAEWLCLRASDFGASHLRKRVFVVAYRTGSRCAGTEDARADRDDASERPRGIESEREGGELAYRTSRGRGERGEPSRSDGLADGSAAELGDASDDYRRRGIGGTETGTRSRGIGRRRPSEPIADVADSERAGLEVGDGQREQHPRQIAEPFAPGPSDARWPAILRERPDLAPALSIDEAKAIDEAAQPEVRRVAHELPSGMDRSGLILGSVMQHRTKRLKALGNAVVPQVAELDWPQNHRVPRMTHQREAKRSSAGVRSEKG